MKLDDGTESFFPCSACEPCWDYEPELVDEGGEG
jgi:hypothetical protein